MRGRWVHAQWHALGVVGFIRGHWFQSGAFIRCRWVHSSATWGSLGSSCVVGVTQERSGYRLVHTGSFGSLHAVRWVHSVAPWGSLGSRGCALGFDAFIMHG